MWPVVNLLLIILVIPSVISTSNSKVLELSDKLIDVHQDGHWYVMFYAPWCAHCKRIEPVWNHVAQSLHSTNIRVGRVDCTRFTAVAKHFGINSYPTIKYLKLGHEFVYSGERSKDDLIHFALRLSGSPVQQLNRADSLDVVKSNNPVFFIFVGAQENNLLWDTFYAAASTYQAHSYFYAAPLEIAVKHFNMDTEPAIIVYKDRLETFFPLAERFDEVDPAHLNETLYQWVNEERFPTFPRITRNNLHHIVQTNKYLVLAVVEENKLAEIAPHELEFRDMIESFIYRNRDKFHKRFQFGWTGSPDLSHSIAAEYLQTPHLIVLNATTHEHHLPDDDPLQLTPEAIESFLESVHNCSAPAYGGNSWGTRVYRAFFEARKGLHDMWLGNPVLTCVLFGLPLGFFSLIIYSICCADILDADEEEEDTHEKKE